MIPQHTTLALPALPVPATAMPPFCQRRGLFRRMVAAVALASGLCAAVAAPLSAEAALEPLTIKKPISALTLNAGSEHPYELAEYFNQRTRVDITFFFGTEERKASVELYDEHAPKNVANFLRYVNGYEWKNEKGETLKTDYKNSFIHRLAKNFVVQGGGFKYDNAKSPTDYTSYSDVPVIENVPNEFKLHNVRGTLSMAKRGGDPNSATSQWFVSLGDNTANLDNQNGGFTVFGSVTDEASMRLFDEINALIDTPENIQGLNEIFPEDEKYAAIKNATGLSYDDKGNIDGGVPFPSGTPVFITKTESRAVRFEYTVTKSPTSGYVTATVDNTTGKLFVKAVGSPDAIVEDELTITARSEHSNEVSQKIKILVYPQSTYVFTTPASPGQYTQGQISDVDFSQYADNTPFTVTNGEISFDGKKWFKKGKLPKNKNEITTIWMRVKGVKTYNTEITGTLTIGGAEVGGFVARTGTPDLILKSYRIIKPEYLPENGKFDVEAIVANQGDAESAAVKLSVYYNLAVKNSLGKLNKATKAGSIPKLKPGEEKKILLKGIVAKLPAPDSSTEPGDTAVTAHIILDAEDKLAESSKENNSATASLQVCQPDVAIMKFLITNSKTGDEYPLNWVEYDSTAKTGGYYEVRVHNHQPFDFAAEFANYGSAPSKPYSMTAWYSYGNYTINGKGAPLNINQYKPVKSASVPKIPGLSYLTDAKGNTRQIYMKKMPNPLDGEYSITIYLDVAYFYRGYYEGGYGWKKNNPRESLYGNIINIKILKK